MTVWPATKPAVDNWSAFNESLASTVMDLAQKCAPPFIVWAPKGVHVISPRGASAPLIVSFSATDASVAERHRLALKAKAEAGNGRAPFFDLNHEGVIVAEPTEFFWSDWGLCASLAWLPAGEAAVLRGEIVSFSPLYAAGPKGQLFGINPNCGGLLTASGKPAFTKMPPVRAWSKRQALDFKADRFVRLLFEHRSEASKKDGVSETPTLSAFEAIKTERPELHAAYALREAIRKEVRTDLELACR